MCGPLLNSIRSAVHLDRLIPTAMAATGTMGVVGSLYRLYAYTPSKQENKDSLDVAMQALAFGLLLQNGTPPFPILEGSFQGKPLSPVCPLMLLKSFKYQRYPKGKPPCTHAEKI